MFDIPILFFVFNRPDTTQKVFEAIRNIRPRYLYVAADGPRLHVDGEVEKCRQAKAVLEQIDWECEVKTFFQTENHGSTIAPFTFIRWFFEQEEMGIVMEHDCLPDNDFFFFCQEMLIRYKNDDRIGIVCGSNFDNSKMCPYSYYFTANVFIWGWASWRRAINLYDVSLENFSKKELNIVLKKYFDAKSEHAFWHNNYRELKQGKLRTWDYQLAFSIWRQGMLSVIPSKNLVSNIGFGDGAMHTTDVKSPLSNRKREPIFPLIHNPEVKRNLESERLFFKEHIIGKNGLAFFYFKLFLKRIGIFPYLMKIKRKISAKNNS